MKRFIRYLYEYEQEKRMRNVGFVKVEQGEDECIVHIHGKGLRMGSETSLQIYLLFEEAGTCFGIWQGEADHINPAVNESISYTVEETGTPENYGKINGIALENRDGRRYAALWNDASMDVSKMRIWRPEESEERQQKEQREEQLREPEEPSEVSEPASEMAEVPSPQLEEMAEEELEERTGEEAKKQETKRQETKRQETGNQETDNIMEAVPVIRSEGIFFTEEPDKPRVSRGWRTKKIQRTELAKLARCEWRLANNNFLLHGYYNYHHLIILEREEQVMLGVPGIYHEKEAAAAGAFGFAEFIARDRLDIKLSPEECNEEHPFGYWCRPVKRAFLWD